MEGEKEVGKGYEMVVRAKHFLVVINIFVQSCNIILITTLVILNVLEVPSIL